MNSIARQFHQTAMDLYDLGRIYKAKGQPNFYKGNLELAFILDKEAALRIQSESEDMLWRAVYPRSAGWLAYKNEKYLEAKQLAELGLSHKNDISDYEVDKLEELLDAANLKIQEYSLSDKTSELDINIIGIVFSANVDENYIQIRKVENQEFQIIQVSKNDILKIARLFLGETVKIGAKKNEDGALILQNIRRAA